MKIFMEIGPTFLRNPEDKQTHTHTHRGTGAVFKAKDSMIVASVSLPQFKLRCTQNEVDRIRAVS